MSQPGALSRLATWWFSPALTVEDRLFRWLAVLRVLVLANAVALNAYRADNFTRPGWGLVCVLAMVAWTPLVSWLFTSATRRTPLLLGVDLALAVALILVSPLVKGDGFNATVPGFWVIGALMAWAVRYRWAGGLVAGVALAGADLAVRQQVTQANAGNVFLLVLGGLIVGSMAESLHRMAAEHDLAQHAAASAAERARLARVVHDGVLQVLGLVQRRGRDDPALADLGRLAGEQEAALRTLVRSPAHIVSSPDTVDLGAELARFATRPGVEVATPAHPVEVPAHVGGELTAVVGACLDNVARHAPGAHAWVFLEALPDRLEVTVRDDGPGIPDGRLEAAAAEGRLGVSQSVRGRVADLGGQARLATGSDGTEWEVVVPLARMVQ